jgi:hypothetical protein
VFVLFGHIEQLASYVPPAGTCPSIDLSWQQTDPAMDPALFKQRVQAR